MIYTHTHTEHTISLILSKLIFKKMKLKNVIQLIAFKKNLCKQAFDLFGSISVFFLLSIFDFFQFGLNFNILIHGSFILP